MCKEMLIPLYYMGKKSKIYKYMGFFCKEIHIIHMYTHRYIIPDKFSLSDS